MWSPVCVRRPALGVNKVGAGKGLAKYGNTPNVCIFVCGGDGTVGWVLETMDKMGLMGKNIPVRSGLGPSTPPRRPPAAVASLAVPTPGSDGLPCGAPDEEVHCLAPLGLV